MILVPLQDVPANSCLARPVFHSERPGQVLLQTGSELPPVMLNRLRETGVRFVWLSRHMSEGRCESPSGTRGQQADEPLARVGDLVTELRAQSRRVLLRGPQGIRLAPLTDCVQALASVMSHRVSHEPPVLQLSSLGRDLAAHLAVTTYFALQLSTHMPRYVREQRNTTSAELWTALIQVGQGAALHDVGKLVTSDQPQSGDYSAAPNELTFDPDDAHYQEHPQRGADALRDILHPTVAYLIANHHQRFNGRGFPRPAAESRYADGPLSGTKIHIFARIVALASAIDHVLGRDLAPHEPVERLQKLTTLQSSGRFDPLLLQAALRLIPAFPEGAQVRLSDGRWATVTHNNVHQPCRPTVVELDKPNCPPADTARSIDLQAEPALHIVEVDGVDVQPSPYTIEPITPDPLNYWALRDVLSKVPRIRLKLIRRELAAVGK